jgi:hypothetical protein
MPARMTRLNASPDIASPMIALHFGNTFWKKASQAVFLLAYHALGGLSG